MAVNTWTNGAADNDGSNAANWSLGAFDPTDTLTWDATNTDACTFSAAVDCAAIDMQIGYTGAYSDGGQDITVSGTANFASGGAITCTGTLTMDADGDFNLNCSGALTVDDWEIDLQGTGNLDLDKSGTIIGKITCAAAGKTTTVTGVSGGVQGAYHTILGTGTFTVSALYYIVGNTDTTIFEGNAAGTINGASQIYLICTNNVNKTYSFAPGPAWGIGCTFRKFSGNGDVVINQTGDWSCAGIQSIYNQTANTDFTWNTNGNDLVNTTGTLTIGTTNATATFHMNFGASTVDIDGSFYTSGYNVGATTLDCGTATITIGQHLTIGSNTTITGTGCSFTFDDALAGNITTAGKTLSDVTIAKAANGITLQDDLACADLALTSGTFDANGNNISCENLDVSTAGATTFDANTTVSGTGDYNVTVTFNRLILTGSTTHTITSGETVTLTTYTAGDMDGAQWASDNPGVAGLLTAPAGGIAVSTCAFTDIDASGGGTITVTGGTDGGGNTNIVFLAGGGSYGVLNGSHACLSCGIAIK